MEEQVQNRTASSARLQFVIDDRSVDITVPTEVPMVDLLPAVLAQFGADTIEAGVEHEGWVLQRLGSDALDEDLTPQQLNLYDGEQLFLRPRADQLAPIDYDDVVAGVGDEVRRHSGAWTPARTRTMLIVAAGVALTLGAPLLVLARAGLAGAALGLLATVLLLVGAGMTARGTTDTATATMLAGVAAVYAATTGVMVGVSAGSTVMALVSVGAAVTVATLAIGVAVVADGAALFTGALTFALMLTVAGLVGTLTRGTVAEAGAVTITVSLLVSLFAPQTAFRLAGLTLPLLPGAPEQLTDDITPVPHRLVLERGEATVGYSAALTVGLGAAQTVLVVPVVLTGGWPAVFGTVVAVLMMLRARHPTGLVQRWATLAPAGAAVISIPLALITSVAPLDRLWVLWLPTVAVGIGLVQLVATMPGRRLRPYWGRAVDILESLTAVAVLPLLLQVLGVFSLMRSLAG